MNGSWEQRKKYQQTKPLEEQGNKSLKPHQSLPSEGTLESLCELGRRRALDKLEHWSTSHILDL